MNAKRKTCVCKYGSAERFNVTNAKKKKNKKNNERITESKKGSLSNDQCKAAGRRKWYGT